MTRSGKTWLHACVCVRARSANRPHITVFPVSGPIRLAGLSYVMLGNEADRVFLSPMTHTAHLRTHTHTHTHVPRSLWWVAGTFSITLHIISGGSWGVCAYSCNRHWSPDTHALVPIFTGATHTVLCDILCITLLCVKGEQKKWGWVAITARRPTNKLISSTICLGSI